MRPCCMRFRARRQYNVLNNIATFLGSALTKCNVVLETRDHIFVNISARYEEQFLLLSNFYIFHCISINCFAVIDMGRK